MKITQLAVQLYTCRDLLQDAAGVSKTLRRLRAIGYTAVQASGITCVSEAEFNQMLGDHGLVCCATHEPSAQILNDPAKVLAHLQALGCNLTSYPFPEGVDLANAAAVHAWIASLRKAGEIFAEAGVTLTYHNHNHEFRKVDGSVILDLIYSGTTLEAELDTYWVQYGGGSIVEWCRKLHGRLPIIHLKDYRTNAENKPELCEIGGGVLNFKDIITAAENAGCKWFAVEQDTCPGDPVDSLAQSFRYIQENLLS